MISANSFQFQNLKQVRETLYREVKIAKFNNILDLGAGNLKISGEISKRIKRSVFALDIKTPSKRPENVFFIKGTALNLPFCNNTFDVITTSFFFVWIKEIDNVFKEVKRVLKRDGIILFLAEPLYKELICPQNFYEFYIKGLMKAGANFSIEETLRKNLEDLGFKTQFRVTMGEREYSKEEFLEEIEFLLNYNLINSTETEILKKEFNLKEYKAALPILYGWAFFP